jgi:hypothetical protein
VHRALRTTLRRGQYCAWRSCRALLSKKAETGPVAILYVYADKAKYPRTRSFIEEYRRWLGERQITLVCIDNFSESAQPRQTHEGVWDIGGDNSYREFSGWRKGLRFLDELTPLPMTVVFANDACLNYAECGADSLFFRTRFDGRAVAQSRKGLVGLVDYAPDQQALLGHDVSSWVRSNFFCLPLKLATALPWVFISEEILDRILPLEYQGVVVSTTADTNENLRVFLTDWITREWRSATQPTAATWPILRKKLAAILNERMLTASVRAQGYDVVEASKLRWL